MKIIGILLPLFICGFSSCTTTEPLSYNVGQKSLKLTDRERNRPLEVEVWYPTQDRLIATNEEEELIFNKIQSIPEASFLNKKLPLLIVSHGTGGNRFSLTWLIEKMVKKGYMVISLGHYGNTTFNKIPREFVKWWERAIDVRFVLDKILEDKEWNKLIDQEKIGGIGHSLGGYTNIALAGGQVDRKYHEGDKENKKRELPPEFPKTEEVIDFQNDSLIVTSYEKYKDKVKDNRIKAFFVMAPAIGFGFHSNEQTKAIEAPILIVAGKGDANTPIKYNALNYHELIPTSELHLFGEKVGHYVFLNEGTEKGKKVLPQITIDNEGVDRKQIHEQVSQMALAFFEKHLKTN